MVLQPAEGVAEEDTQVRHMPWLEREKRGRIKAWFSTIGMALVAPNRLMQSVPPQSSTGQAWWFAIITNVLVLLCSVAPFAIFPLVFVLGTGAWRPGMAPIIGGMAGLFALIVVALNVFIAISGLVAHGLLRLTGLTAGPLGRTYQAICYSSGANVCSAIPCFGIYIGWLWWLISAILMVKEGQRVHGGRATFAVASFPGLVVVAIVSLYAWLIFSSVTMARTSAMSAMASADTQTVLDAVSDYSTEHQGRGPEHAIQLVSAGSLAAFDLLATGSNTTAEHVPVTNTTLGRFEMLTIDRQRSVAQAAIDALPDGTIAHRLGDFVFTHHGIDLSDADPELWLVILWPDPKANPSPMMPATQPVRPGDRRRNVPSTGISAEVIAVGLADQTVMEFPLSSFASELAAQNKIRAEYDLPLLPDPATIAHDRRPPTSVPQ